MDKLTIASAAAALEKATKAFDNAKREADAARSLETDALNDLNKAQRAFDDAVAEVKAKPPWNSDWWSKTNRGVQI